MARAQYPGATLAALVAAHGGHEAVASQVGVTRFAIRHWLMGAKVPRYDRARDFARVLGIDVEVLHTLLDAARADYLAEQSAQGGAATPPRAVERSAPATKQKHNPSSAHGNRMQRRGGAA